MTILKRFVKRQKHKQNIRIFFEQRHKQTIIIFFSQLFSSPTPFFFFFFFLCFSFLFFCYSSTTTTMPLLFSATQPPLLPLTPIPSSSSAKITSHNKKSTVNPNQNPNHPPPYNYTKFTSQRNNTKKKSNLNIQKSDETQKPNLNTNLCLQFIKNPLSPHKTTTAVCSVVVSLPNHRRSDLPTELLRLPLLWGATARSPTLRKTHGMLLWWCWCAVEESK